MKKIKVKLNRNYKQFKSGWEHCLEGDLIILTGVNGSGKSQLLDILSMEATVQGTIGPISNIELSDNNGNLLNLKKTDISKRGFKDVKMSNITSKESWHSGENWHKKQAWKIINSPISSNDTVKRQYSKAIAEVHKSLEAQNIAITGLRNMTEKDFIALLPNDFQWVADDMFSNDIYNLFDEFASLRHDEMAVCGMRGGEPYDQKSSLKIAPWTKLNELFEFLKFDYRFKADYDYSHKNLTEIPKLHPLNKQGKINEHETRELIDLSDGEKSIISLVFALIRIDKRPMDKILLLDEFDNTLNPTLIDAFYKVIDEYFIKRGILVVIATHSPVTVSMAPEYAHFYEMFKQDNDTPKIIKVNRYEYSELEVANLEFYEKISRQEERIKDLELENDEKEKIINSSKKAVLFVEDRYTQIYKLAWLKLYGKEEINCGNVDSKFDEFAPFEIYGKGGCATLQGLVNSEYLSEWDGKKVVALFDFDDAYSIFSNLKSSLWTDVKGDEEGGLFRTRKQHINVSAMVLPVPSHRKLIASRDQKTNKLEVELYFTDDDIHGMYEGQEVASEMIFAGVSVLKINNKNDFWVKALVLGNDKFESFRTLFNKVFELFEMKLP